MILTMEEMNQNTYFIKDVRNKFIQYGKLTDNQRDSLNNIYTKFIKKPE